jgi:calcium-dependent protein kinase
LIIEIKVKASIFVGEKEGKLRDHYRIGKLLGSGKHLFKAVTGAFGEVRMCLHKETNTQRAVKVLRKSALDEKEIEMLLNEINILKDLVLASTYS